MFKGPVSSRKLWPCLLAIQSTQHRFQSSREPYYSVGRPHEKTSLMAQFWDEVPRSILTEATPSALSVFQARLSMTATEISTPIQLSLPPNSSSMALLQCGGYKDRDPVLSVFFCDVESTDDDFCKSISTHPGRDYLKLQAI